MPYIGTEISPTGKPINAKGTLINKYRNLKRSYRDINAEPCETEGVPESEFLARMYSLKINQSFKQLFLLKVVILLKYLDGRYHLRVYIFR